MNLFKFISDIQEAFCFYGSSGGGGGGGDSTSTVKNEPPNAVLPFLKPYMQWASQLSHAPYQPFGGQQIADLNPVQLMGMDMAGKQATGGFQGQREGNNIYQQTLRGDFLTPESNPYLAKTAQTIGDQFNNTVGAQNASMQRTAGAFGNSGLSQKMSQDNAGFAGQLNNLYGQNYANERANQMSAMGMMPTMQEMGYRDSQALTGIGDSFRQYQQDLLNQQQQNYSQAMNYPSQMLDMFGNSITRTMGTGGSSTTTNSVNGYRPSPMAGAIGGGMAGYGAAQAMGMSNPWLGAAGGAVMGGLL